MDDTCADLLPLIPERENRPTVFGRSGNVVWTRAELRYHIRGWVERLVRPVPSLVFVLVRNEPEILAALYGAIAGGHSVALLDAGAPSTTLARLTQAFRPDFVISADSLSAVPPADAHAAEPAPGDAAVLLSTSGTTGSSKFVRLAPRNLVANADQIIAALGMGPTDVGIAHLPLHYSYGLSIVTSHLRIGAAVHLWPDSVTVPEFWRAADVCGATQFPGVPFHYQFLARGDLTTLLPPSLRTFTQAGGALAPRLQTRMHQNLSAIGARFFVMYGQTEAAPRMTTLPHERMPDKLGSVGIALPGSRLVVVDEEGGELPCGDAGRIIFHGPNVMLGYAESRADLALGDVMDGRLETGDLGRLDAEGFLTLTGRSKRFAKLHGLRLSLDEVEARFAGEVEVAAADGGEKIVLFTPAPEAVRALLAVVAAEYKVPTASFAIRPVDALPRKPSGKIDYASLELLP